MTRGSTFCLVLALASGAAAAAAPAPAAGGKDLGWLVGPWAKKAAEKKSPDDVVEFREDGTFVTYGPGCQRTFSSYFLRDGYIYITIVAPLKGPIALMFVPSEDRKSLTFTSPRTFENATYEKAPSAECKTDH